MDLSKGYIKMIELPIYAVDTKELKEAEISGEEVGEEIIKIMIDPARISAFHEDGENTTVFIDGLDFKIAVEYEILKELLTKKTEILKQDEDED